MNYKPERQFALLIAVASAIYALWPLWRAQSPRIAFLLLGSAALALIPIPRLLTPFLKIWLKFGEVLGWLSSKVVLATVFFLLVTPIALLRRFVGHSEFNRRDSSPSYWRPRTGDVTPESMRNQY